MKRSAIDILMQKKKEPKKRPLSTNINIVDCPAGCGARLVVGEKLHAHLDQCLAAAEPAAAATVVVSPTDQGSRRRLTESTGKKNMQRVECPSCQRSFPESHINLHLDLCLQKEPAAASSADKDVGACEDRTGNDDPQVSSETGVMAATVSPSSSQQAPRPPTSGAVTSNAAVSASLEVPKKKDTTCSSDVFTTMMHNAKRAFAEPDLPPPPLPQLFHLRADGSISLVLHANSLEEEVLTTIWSAIIAVRDREQQAVVDEASTDLPANDVYHVTVSCALPSRATAARQWVRRHSRLSVPVLKSLLQKSIRRRRPLPSVRIAMELADRALSELLRRLPIIVLEDAMLHPEFDFLVWLMMAQSKDYNIPIPMMVRVFQIIFEVASCPRNDPLPETATTTPTMTLQRLHGENHRGVDRRSSHCDTLVWSILVRAAYGGMKGDIRMLRSYAHVWSDRFCGQQVPLDGGVLVEDWSGIPIQLHQRAREQSQKVVVELCSHRHPVECLRIEDLCPAAIDFHCSSVVQHVLSEAAGLCRDFLVQSHHTWPNNNNAEDGPAALEAVVRKCIWVYSAGKNHRFALQQHSGTTSPVKKEDDVLHRLWTEILAPRVLAFQKKYLVDRIVRE